MRRLTATVPVRRAAPSVVVPEPPDPPVPSDLSRRRRGNLQVRDAEEPAESVASMPHAAESSIDRRPARSRRPGRTAARIDTLQRGLESDLADDV